MALTQTDNPHVTLREDGIPLVADSTMKVSQVVAEHRYWGWDAKEIQRQHSYLTLAQVNGALAYYWDHQEAIDEEMQRDDEYVDQMEASFPSPVSERLRALLRA